MKFRNVQKAHIYPNSDGWGNLPFEKIDIGDVCNSDPIFFAGFTDIRNDIRWATKLMSHAIRHISFFDTSYTPFFNFLQSFNSLTMDELDIRRA